MSLTTPHFLVPADEDVLNVAIPKLRYDVRSNTSHALVIDCLLESSESWISSRVRGLKQPGLRLDLGLQRRSRLLQGNELHLYAVALADRIKELAGVQFNSVKLTKSYNELSVLSVTEAVPTRTPTEEEAATLITRRSYATPAFAKDVYAATQNIRDVAIRGKPIRMNVSYVTGLPRTWSRLWRPTVSAVWGIESSSPTIDLGQIVDLSLAHISAGERLEHKVLMTISASAMRSGA